MVDYDTDDNMSDSEVPVPGTTTFQIKQNKQNNSNSKGNAAIGALSEGFAALQIESNRTYFKDSPRLTFGSPPDDPEEYLQYGDYEARHGAVTMENLHGQSIYVQPDKTKNVRVPASQLEQYLEDDLVARQKANETYNRERDEKRLFGEATKKGNAIRMELGLPPKGDMKLEKKPVGTWTDKEGVKKPRYKLSGEERYFIQDERGERGRNNRYGNKVKALSGESAPDVLAINGATGTIKAYNFEAGKKPVGKTDRQLSNALGGVIHYKSFADNNAYLSASELEARGTSAQRYINSFRNEHPGPGKVLVEAGGIQARPDPFLREPDSSISQKVIAALQNHPPVDGEVAVKVKVQMRNGVYAPANYVALKEPKHFQKAMIELNVSTRNWGVKDKSDNLRKGTDAEIKAVSYKNISREGAGDGDEVWLQDRQEGMLYRSNSDHGKALLAKLNDPNTPQTDQLAKTDIFIDKRNANGKLTGRMESLSTIPDREIKGVTLERLAQLGLGQRVGERSGSDHMDQPSTPTREATRPSSPKYDGRQRQPGIGL